MGSGSTSSCHLDKSHIIFNTFSVTTLLPLCPRARQMVFALGEDQNRCNTRVQVLHMLRRDEEHLSCIVKPAVAFRTHFLPDGVHSGTALGPGPGCGPSPSAPADSALYSAGRKRSGCLGTRTEGLMAISVGRTEPEPDSGSNI